MCYVRYQNQKLPHFAEFLLDKYKLINLLNNNTTVVRDKTKFSVEENTKSIPSSHFFLMNGAEQKIRGQ